MFLLWLGKSKVSDGRMKLLTCVYRQLSIWVTDICAGAVLSAVTLVYGAVALEQFHFKAK